LKIAILNSPLDITIIDRPIPSVGEQDLLLEVIYCGICGTDLKLYQGKGPFKLTEPTILGHEIVARVHTVGEKVKEIKKGEKVVINPMKSLVGLGGIDGAFAKYLFLPNAQLHNNEIYKVGSLPDEWAALVEPLAVALHGINKLKFSVAASNEKVFISGAGPIGLCALAAIRAKSITNIIVAEPNIHRQKIALKMGASKVIDPLSLNVKSLLEENHGTAKPAFLDDTFPTTNIFIECSGHPTALQTALDLMGENSQLLVLAAKGKIELDIATLQAKGGQIITSIIYEHEFAEAIKLLQSKVVDFQPMITHIMSLEEIGAAFELLCEPQTKAGKILIKP